MSQCTNPSPRGWGFTQIPRPRELPRELLRESPRELLRESLLELAPRDNCVTATDGHHAEHDDRPADEFSDYRQLTQPELGDEYGNRRHQIEQ